MIDRGELERAWRAAEPPSDFAERVLQKVTVGATSEAGATAERSSAPAPSMADASWTWLALGSASRWITGRRARVSLTPGRSLSARSALALVACVGVTIGLWLTVAGPHADHGEVLAERRTQLPLGGGGVGVLESGAHVAWSGRQIRQVSGDVFYRVEPGEPFSVETPVGDVAVRGTCFRIRLHTPEGAEMTTVPGVAAKGKARDMLAERMYGMGAGVALGALATVIVYEGEVQLSQAEARLELGAGEAATMGPEGIRRVDDAPGLTGEPSPIGGVSASAAPAAGELSQRDEAALHQDIGELGRKLKLIEADKAELQRRLGRAESELARRGRAVEREHNDFDLDQDDWKKLAETGSIKYRVPCQVPGGWTPGPEVLDRLGLAPDDAEVIRAAHQRSNQRIWNALRPLCVEALGNDEVVDLIGADNCTHVVLGMANKADRESAQAAMRAVGETRAGERPPPAPGVQRHPVFDLFWALTGEMQAFEADLAESFGPEDAKRIAFSPSQSCTSSYGAAK
jgi:hypothetical protein